MSTPVVNEHQHDKPETAVLLAVYGEICRSYQAIDDFRTKLLGFLPLTSLAGLFLFNNGNGVLTGSRPSNELLGFAGLFASALTLALFGYEVRGMQRSHHLIAEGTHLEQQLGIEHGHFHVCSAEHANGDTIAQVFNAKLLACVIYSVVFAGWLFVALRLGFGLDTLTCSLSAVAVGLVLAFAVSLLVRKLIPA